jgi:hypothetical protein
MIRKRKLHWMGWIGYSVLAVAFSIFLVLLVFRYFGLPQQIGDRLGTELERRGLTVQFERLYLDPFGQVVAKNLQVFQESPASPNTLLVEEIRFRFNWLSWWRGEPFLEGGRISKANLRFPLSEQEVVHFEDVQLGVRLVPGGYEIDYARGRILNVEIEAEGRLDISGIQPSQPDAPTAEEMAQRAAIWKSIEKVADQFSTESPIGLRFEFDWFLADPDRSRAKLRVSAGNQVWNGVVMNRIDLEANWLNSLLRLDGEVESLRGSLQLQGNWVLGQEEARLSMVSDIDLSLISPALSGQPGRLLSQARFRVLPINEAEIVLNWAEGLTYHARLRCLWEDFSVRDSQFERLVLPAAYDGTRWIVSDMELSHPTGTARINAYYDGDSDFRADIVSSIDPTVLKPFLGEGAQPFLNSLEFTSGGPEIECSVRGKGLDPESFVIEGVARAAAFSYKEVPLQSVKSSFTLEDGAIHLPDIEVEREEGKGSGEVWHSFRDQIVEVKNVKTQLNLSQTARIIGDKMEEYAQPYRFFEAPYCEAEGRVDLKTQETTDIRVKINSAKGMRYEFLGRMLTLRHIDADLHILGDKLMLRPRKPISLFEGKMAGTLDVFLEEETGFLADLDFESIDFGGLMHTFFKNEDVTGTLDGSINLRGKFDNLKSLNGLGDVTITRGVLYPIPIFGTFSEILNSMVPNLGYAQADKARSNFKIEEGFVSTEKIDVYSTAFALIGYGKYNFIEDEVDMSMRVNIRGPLGFITFPFSKLFEYQGTGSLDNTKWEPKSF